MMTYRDELNEDIYFIFYDNIEVCLSDGYYNILEQAKYGDAWDWNLSDEEIASIREYSKYSLKDFAGDDYTDMDYHEFRDTLYA